ncbi:MAG: hypothetical protein ACLQVD_08140 [Capsulimonadaceae bacterium]
MWHSNYDDDDGFHLAGERVSAGFYRLVEGNGRQIFLETEDVLPATLDGRVACYLRVENTWGQIERSPRMAVAS